MVTLARTMVDTLEASGIERVFGVPGDSLNGFTDALRTNKKIEWVHTRHEEAAALAAAAHAATSGELSVCAGSCGPGNMHLINGLYDAHRSRVPVLAIAAHIPSDEIGSNYFQETHPEELFRGCSDFVETVTNPAQMPRLLRIAMRTAVEKNGVAVLVVPGDTALLEAQDDTAQVVLPTRSTVLPSAEELARAVTALDGKQKVTILGGAGCQGAHEEVVALAERLQAPIVHSLRGKEFLEYDNPYDVGLTGLLGFASGYHAIQECDTLLMLGTDFPYPQFYPDDATVIQVDIRGENIGRRTNVDIPLVGGVKETAQALLDVLPGGKSSKHLETMQKHYAKTRAKLDDLATPSRPKKAIHPQYLTKLLDEAASEDAVFIPDVGSPVVWAARYITVNGKRRVIGSFNHGTMANALSHGIGVQAKFPKRQVVALAGDGGLTMLLGELVTLTQHDLPVKTVVYNNSSLNFIELEMKAAGFVTFGTELKNPDFSKVAEAIGIKGFRVEDSADLPAVVAEFLAYDGPALLDVVTERQELSMPPNVTAAQAKGFALWAIRTVMSGKGDELVDLTKKNVRQIL